MKHMKLFVWVFAGLGCVALQAQTAALTAKIPFDFQFGKTAMPAGNYRVDYSGGVLTMRCWEARKAAFAIGTPASRSKASETSQLQFNRYGDTYFFAGAWLSNSTNGVALPQSSHERELARRLGSPQPAGVALATGR